MTKTITAESVSSPPSAGLGAVLPIASKPRIGRIVAAVLCVLALGTIIVSLARNKAIEWPVVAEYMFSERVIAGLWLTLKLTAVSMAFALVLAIVIANMRLSTNPVLRSVSWLFVWAFRGVPLLVLIILMFNFALFYPTVSVGFPGLEPLWSADSVSLINPFWAAVIAFTLHQSSYTSEVIRTSILAVPKGQVEAAESLGMTQLRAFIRIVLPQAMRIAVPPIANDAINLLKATSLVAFIAVSDLLYSVQQIYTVNYKVVPLLFVATIWYVAIVSAMSVGQWVLERRLGRGAARPKTTLKERKVKTV